jgi:hypothetical protein
VIIAHQAGVSNCKRAAILSWRRTSQFEEVLLVTENKASQWSIVRAQRFFADLQPIWEGFISLDAPATSVVETPTHPSDHDLAQFADASWWDRLETSPRIESWGVSHDAWAWATGKVSSTELYRELDRLKRYVFLDRSSRDVAKSAARFASFVLLPGRSVVFPESASAKFQCSRVVPDSESTWTPLPADIAALESMLYKLNPVLYRGGANAERRTPLRCDVNDYHRQYFGLQIGSRRFIYVNALHNRSVGKNWQTEILAICDGGFNAWGALYDPSTQEFLDFTINGGV